MGNTARTLDSYSYADYKTWNDDQRYELIEGFLYMMSPAPSLEHQEIAGSIYSSFKNQLKNKKCKTYIAPIDVLLDFNTNEDYSKSIVQPDVLVVYDNDKLRSNGVFGAPDLVIEVASPSTIDYDFSAKKQIYCKYGVPEYWIVLPADKTIIVYNLENGKYKTTNYIKTGKIESTAVEGLAFNLKEIFEEIQD